MAYCKLHNPPRLRSVSSFSVRHVFPTFPLGHNELRESEGVLWSEQHVSYAETRIALGSVNKHAWIRAQSLPVHVICDVAWDKAGALSYRPFQDTRSPRQCWIAE